MIAIGFSDLLLDYMLAEKVYREDLAWFALY